MFWGDSVIEDILRRRTRDVESGAKEFVVRDEKTASGRMLISALRGAAIHGVIDELLSERGTPHTFLWEINDTDAFRSIPKGLDEETYRPYLGFPLYTLPSPGEGADNYPNYFANEFKEVMEHLGFAPSYYASSEAYREGKFNEAIKTALEKAELIRDIYKRVSGSEKPDGWLPVMMVCEGCGKIGTTRATAFDGEKVFYTCTSDEVEWAKGCGHEGSRSPFDGNATLPWKVEWAAKFKVFSVDVEGGGKDLSTKGGARDVSNHIARDVFEYEPPFDIPYEFFLAGGKKMSTSKGNAPAARDVVEILPPHMYRLVFLGKSYKQAIEFNIMGDTIPTLFDMHDRLAEKAWGGIDDDDTRLFSLIHKNKEGAQQHFLPRFSQVAFLVQMPHMSLEEEVKKMKGGDLTEADIRELEERARYARAWLERYAPEKYRFELQESSVPGAAKKFSEEQKKALVQVLKYIQSHEVLDGQMLHTELHEIRKKANIGPKEFFSALYLSFLGKESGPKAGWFLSVLDRDFLIKRLTDVSR